MTRWGLAQAIGYTDRIEAACAALAVAPLQAPGCDHIRPGYRRRGVGRHVLYIRQTGYGSPSSASCTSAWMPSGICEEAVQHLRTRHPGACRDPGTRLAS